MDIEDLFTQAELANLIGVSRQRVAQIQEKLNIKPMWVGGIMFYTQSQARAFMNREIGKPGRPPKKTNDLEECDEEDTEGYV